jgi:hypothetical protein
MKPKSKKSYQRKKGAGTYHIGKARKVNQQWNHARDGRELPAVSCFRFAVLSVEPSI